MALDTTSLDKCLGEISKLRKEFGEASRACIYTDDDLTWLAPSTLSPAGGRTTPLVSMDSANSPSARLTIETLQSRVEMLEVELLRKDEELSYCRSERDASAEARAQFELRRQIEDMQELLEFCRREKEIAVQTLEEKLSEKTREALAAEERLRTAQEEFAEAMQNSEASNQRTRKQLQDLMASHRKLEAAIKMLTAKSEPGPTEVPVDQLMDDLKVKVITLDKRIASVIANIGCWADKEHVLQRAFSEVKRLVIELKGAEPTEVCWDLSPSCFVEIPSRTRHGLLKALQELVVAWEMLPGSRHSLPLCNELATNGEYIKRLASEIRRADAVAASAAANGSRAAATTPACAARSRTPINSPGEKPRPAVVTSPAVLRRNKLAAQTTPKKSVQREPPPLSSRLLHPSLLPHTATAPATATVVTATPLPAADAPTAPLMCSPAPLNFGTTTPEPEAPVAFRSLSNPAGAIGQSAMHTTPPLRPVPRTRSPASSRSNSPALSSRPVRIPPGVCSAHQGGSRHGGRAAEDAARRPVPASTAVVVPPAVPVADRL